MVVAIVVILGVLIGALSVASIDAQSIMLNVIGVGFILGLIGAFALSQSSKIDYDFKDDSTVTALISLVGSLCAVVGVLFFFHQI